jgi:hypothetical protein
MQNIGELYQAMPGIETSYVVARKHFNSARSVTAGESALAAAGRVPSILEERKRQAGMQCLLLRKQAGC